MDSGSLFTLICATASTVTATPCLVYRFCCGATSNDINCSESCRTFSTIGKITVPRPFTMRVPRNPYTMRASCGPALRYRVAIDIINASNVSTAMTAINTISFDISSLLLQCFGACHAAQPGHCIPGTYIRNSFFVADDYDLFVRPDFDSVFRACRHEPARSILRVNDFTDAAGPDAARNPSERSDHFVIGRVHGFFAALQKVQEGAQKPGACQPDNQRKRQIHPERQPAMPR